MTQAIAPTPPAPASLVERTDRRNTAIQLELGVVQYRVIWVGVVAVLLFLIAYLLGHMCFYVAATRWPLAWYFAETYQLLPSTGFLVAVAANVPLCLLAIRRLLNILQLSIHARQLCLSQADLPARLTSSISPSTSSPTRQHRRKSLQSQLLSFKMPRTRESLKTLIEWVIKYTGVRGRGYEVGTLLRDVLQIISLTVQAYNASRYTVSVALSACFTALIAVTCFAGPLIRCLQCRSLAYERCMTLIVDLAVDATFLALPIVLFFPYMTAFAGDQVLTFQDSYGARALTELRILFVGSYLAIFVKIVPVASMLLTISKICELARRRQSDTTTTAALQLTSLFSMKVATRWDAVVPTFGPVQRRQHQPLRPIERLYKLRFAQRMLASLLVLWGLIAVSAFGATLQSADACPMGCELVLHPWFVSSRCRCAVQRLDCYQRGITGRALEVHRALSEMERTGLATLIILHCPALEIPPVIRSFTDLYQFEVYNSSIVAWPREAAISSSRLGSLYLVRTHVDTIPTALLSHVPATLKEVGIIVSTLRDLPHDLDVRWPHVKTLYLDHAQLTHVPPVLGRMHLDSLSLYNNSITHIADDTFHHSAFRYLLLNANPLTTLPRTLGDTSHLCEIQIQQTNITHIDPQWALAPNAVIYARGSPLCDSGKRLLPAGVSCEPHSSLYGANRSLAYYPLEGKTQERRIIL